MLRWGIIVLLLTAEDCQFLLPNIRERNYKELNPYFLILTPREQQPMWKRGTVKRL